jgi:hypothetical protein
MLNPRTSSGRKCSVHRGRSGLNLSINRLHRARAIEFLEPRQMFAAGDILSARNGSNNTICMHKRRY